MLLMKETNLMNLQGLPADVFTNNINSAQRLPCIFCKGDHYNDECDKYVALSDV